MSRCKCPPAGPNMGYLVSFGDTMTALLAFFIVLNSLAEEQTGANLHAGTGSFVQTLSSMGVPGMLDTKQSKQAFQHSEPSPLYMVPDPQERPPEKNGSGPDDDNDEGRVIDRQREDFNRFLQEIRRLSPLQKERGIAGEVSFDILGTLPREGSLMTPEVRETLNGISPQLRQSDYAIEITVWATTPSQTAWSRAVEQAVQLRKEAAAYLRLNPEQQQRVTAVGRSWISRDIKRPAASITLRRLVAE